MNRKFILPALLAILTVSLSVGSAWAGEIKGQVKPQGLRSAGGILVYLPKAPKAPGAAARASYVVDQRNLAFIPHMLPVPVGAVVEFPNNDKVDHNVFSLSKAKKFNLGSFKPGQTIKVTFNRPGVVELRCDVHQEMMAYVLVLKNPYFALTATDGSFSIPAKGRAALSGG